VVHLEPPQDAKHRLPQLGFRRRGFPLLHGQQFSLGPSFDAPAEVLQGHLQTEQGCQTVSGEIKGGKLVVATPEEKD
jgi:hypothetical protein